ncbi:uncharacterized protein LOC127514217 [Ctenopharyngodon idella]|uniref:uncharacterized protein LOC127514217 n=1 Tax=Ctenopharyngodon idella TaxID=7959 RepID=UPI00222F832D|nr:uncharacterized protein LOC127514217 [Ctenopharyngodon idella]
MTSAPAHPDQPAPPLLPPGYPMFSVSIGLDSGLQRGSGANLKILLILASISHSFLLSQQMSPMLKPHTITIKLTILLIPAHFSKLSLICPPPLPPTSVLTADDFATFFTHKITTISCQFSTPHTDNNILMENTQILPSFSMISEADVSKLILSNHSITCPLDPIPTHLLQAISSSIVPALTHIINSSLHTGTFPTAFKQARITPLLKKPTLNPALLENYRLVSLLPFIVKILERVVFNQLSTYLTQNNLLDNNHSGFKSGHSTETALISVTEALRLAQATSKSSVLILLDLSAAFDTVNHQILLSTLMSKGISGTALQWFESYLSDDPTVAGRIAACLTAISAWMKDHHLQLNLAKMELLVVGANPTLHHNLSIQLGSSTITPSRMARNLGVVMDDCLSFTDHIATTAGLPCTTLGRSDPSYWRFPHKFMSKLLFYPDWTIVMLSWQAFQHALSSLYN